MTTDVLRALRAVPVGPRDAPAARCWGISYCGMEFEITRRRLTEVADPAMGPWGRLRSDLEPASRALAHVRIVAWRILAVVPVLRRWRLLRVHGRCCSTTGAE